MLKDMWVYGMFCLGVVTGALAAWNALSHYKYSYERIEKECIAYLDKINAPRNNTCHVFVTYKIKEGEKK